VTGKTAATGQRNPSEQRVQFSAYLNTLRWGCITATDAALVKAPYRAGVDMKAYQLEPLRQREDDKANRFGLVGLSVKDRAYVAKGREERHPMTPLTTLQTAARKG